MLRCMGWQDSRVWLQTCTMQGVKEGRMEGQGGLHVCCMHGLNRWDGRNGGCSAACFIAQYMMHAMGWGMAFVVLHASSRSA